MWKQVHEVSPIFFLVLPNHLIELRFLGRLILDNESFKLYAQEGAIHVV